MVTVTILLEELSIEARSLDDVERILSGLAKQGFPAHRLSDLAIKNPG